MKWTSLTIDLSRIRKIAQQLAAMSKAFGTLSLCTFVFFAVLGTAGYVQNHLHRAPISSMKGWAASISNDFFLDAMGLEIPQLQNDSKSSTFSQSHTFQFVFRLLTDINLKDPKSYLAREVPGLGVDNPLMLRKGSGSDDSGGPEDYSPGDGSKTGGVSPNKSGTDPGSAESTPQPSAAPSTAPSTKPQDETGLAKKVVMIYHSHNRESYLPELKNVTNPDLAYDSKVNVTLVGKHLAQKLEEQGIGSIDYGTDYSSVVKNFNFAYSYKYSQKTVMEAFAAHPEIRFVFDIHRDSLARSKTTATINGKDYAQVYFIIGQRNPHWEKNEDFANQINQRLEKTMPGLSRGVWGKTPHDGNAEYNQSLAENSVLIEIGGPYNSLEECYRTVDVLAGAIADLYHQTDKEATPVDAKITEAK
ncbi:stage II sporulation protein P [Gorillibacterium massiliense]|uniref:stage II sporulation protein P n=1 Tax=Gorillibacterium massiliense TaxID=1280390 RepID=UPI0004B5C65A|nr:stage II sporulation protein P [Gorillibacterium massiliense]